MTTTHVRKAYRRVDRRIRSLNQQVAPATICGAPVTDRDWTTSDAKRASAGEREKFNVCPECLSGEAVVIKAHVECRCGFSADPCLGWDRRDGQWLCPACQ